MKLRNETKEQLIEILNGMILNLYDYSCVGGLGHIVFDDYNVSDDNIDFCIDNIFENNDIEITPEERIITLNALILLKFFDEEEREAIVINVQNKEE